MYKCYVFVYQLKKIILEKENSGLSKASIKASEIERKFKNFLSILIFNVMIQTHYFLAKQGLDESILYLLIHILKSCVVYVQQMK